MAAQAILALISILVLFGGAELLVRGSASLAVRFGLTPLAVGLTVVAFGTSMPELVVSVNASLRGLGDLAVGNVIGSNIFNVGIILGLAALIRPLRVQVTVIRVDVPILIAASVLLLVVLRCGAVSRLLALGLLAGLTAYILLTFRLAKRRVSPDVAREFAAGVPARAGSLRRDILSIGAGLLFLVLGSRLLVAASVGLARALGVGEAVIGLTVVAAGTSMPELATSLVAAFRRQPDIAVGNVVGSNIFNLLGILGIAGILRPFSAPGITALDLGVMAAFSLGLLPLLWTGARLRRGEGVLLLLGYAAYLWLLWP